MKKKIPDAFIANVNIFQSNIKNSGITFTKISAIVKTYIR